MSISKQLTEKYQESQTEKKFRVPSKSKKGEYHIVRILKNGEIECDCIASHKFGAECSHIKIVKNL